MTTALSNMSSGAAMLSIEPASAWDVLFFVNEVFAGAAAGHFSQDSRSSRAHMTLALRCCKAIIGRKVFRKSDDLQFVVARSGKDTIGAALASSTPNEDGKPTTTLEYVVVDARFRRGGIGAALVQHFVDAGTCVQCWCTPKSTQMQTLLRKLRFKRLQKATSTRLGEAHVVSPALWQWSADDVSPHIGARIRRVTSLISTQRKLREGLQQTL